jgi:acyl carrier protein
MKERIKEIMKNVFELELIEDNISKSNCTNWDSLRHLNLIIEIEAEFDILFEPEEIARMVSLNYIVGILKGKYPESGEKLKN